MLSIIIPVYNQRKYTEKLLAQIPVLTLSDFEIIVIDSASTDETTTEIKKYTNVRYIKSNTNIYVNGAWNLWVQEAKGEYICIINNDIELTQWRDKPLIDNLRDNILITSPIYTTWPTPFNWRWYRNNPSNPFNICWHCFCMRKENWEIIPDNFKIWFGDNRQYEKMVRKKGIELAIADSKIHHYESKTVKSKNNMIEYIISQDKIQWDTFAKDHFTKKDLWK